MQLHHHRPDSQSSEKNLYLELHERMVIFHHEMDTNLFSDRHRHF